MFGGGCASDAPSINDREGGGGGKERGKGGKRSDGYGKTHYLSLISRAVLVPTLHHYDGLQQLTASQFSGGINAGIVPRETDEYGAAILLVDYRLDVRLDVVEDAAHGFCSCC